MTKPFLGRSVENGFIRYSSVSQIVQFDPRYEGGCNRRWAWRYVAGKKEEKTIIQEGGITDAKVLEHYLKTGEDVLTPTVRAAKHLFPKPGPDLEVEKEFALDIEKAIKLREAEREGLIYSADIRLYAGLSLGDIPFIGAADFRHRRGEYIDNNGQIQKEDANKIVVETGDLKTIKRIFNITTRNGNILPGYAKSLEEILEHPQMVGYGSYSAWLYPDTTHVRLSHIYAERSGGRSVDKRTGLLEVAEVRERWQGFLPVIREMEQVARGRPEDAPANFRSCEAFHRLCDHAAYCDRSGTSIFDLLGENTVASTFQDLEQGTLFGSETATASNGQSGLFGVIPPPAPPIPANLPMGIPAVDAYVSQETTATPPSPLFVVIKCAACAVKGTLVEYAPSISGGVCPKCGMVAGINPPDKPAFDPIAAAAPLPPDVIATITDPALRARVEAHARAAASAAPVATQSAAAQSADTQTRGRCKAGGSVIAISPAAVAKKSIECPSCGKALKIKEFSADFSQATIPGHNITPAESAPPPPASPPPPPPMVVQSFNQPPLPSWPSGLEYKSTDAFVALLQDIVGVLQNFLRNHPSGSK